MFRLNLKNFSFAKILNPKYVCDFNFRKVLVFFNYIFQKFLHGNLFDIKIIFSITVNYVSIFYPTLNDNHHFDSIPKC